MQRCSIEPLPTAEPRPPPSQHESPTPLDADLRFQQVRQLLDLLTDASVGDTQREYLDGDARARAQQLLVKACTACQGFQPTADDPTGSPACWALLLAQQAFAETHGGWKMDAQACPRWAVRVMHGHLSDHLATTPRPAAAMPFADGGAMPRGSIGAQRRADAAFLEGGRVPMRCDPLGDDKELKAKADFLHRMLCFGDDDSDGLLQPIRELEPPAPLAAPARMLGRACSAAALASGFGRRERHNVVGPMRSAEAGDAEAHAVAVARAGGGFAPSDGGSRSMTCAEQQAKELRIQAQREAAVAATAGAQREREARREQERAAHEAAGSPPPSSLCGAPSLSVSATLVDEYGSHGSSLSVPSSGQGAPLAAAGGGGTDGRADSAASASAPGVPPAEGEDGDAEPQPPAGAVEGRAPQEAQVDAAKVLRAAVRLQCFHRRRRQAEGQVHQQRLAEEAGRLSPERRRRLTSMIDDGKEAPHDAVSQHLATAAEQLLTGDAHAGGDSNAWCRLSGEWRRVVDVPASTCVPQMSREDSNAATEAAKEASARGGQLGTRQRARVAAAAIGRHQLRLAELERGRTACKRRADEAAAVCIADALTASAYMSEQERHGLCGKRVHRAAGFLSSCGSGSGYRRVPTPMPLHGWPLAVPTAADEEKVQVWKRARIDEYRTIETAAQNEGKSDGEGEQCSICLFTIVDAVDLDGCTHRGCEDCMTKWVVGHSSTCPLCRHEVTQLLRDGKVVREVPPTTRVHVDAQLDAEAAAQLAAEAAAQLAAEAEQYRAQRRQERRERERREDRAFADESAVLAERAEQDTPAARAQRRARRSGAGDTTEPAAAHQDEPAAEAGAPGGADAAAAPDEQVEDPMQEEAAGSSGSAGSTATPGLSIEQIAATLLGSDGASSGAGDTSPAVSGGASPSDDAAVEEAADNGSPTRPPPGTKTMSVCPAPHGRGGHAWSNEAGPKRHRERHPNCPFEPLGVAFKRAKRRECVVAAEQVAVRAGGTEKAVTKAAHRAGRRFNHDLVYGALAEWHGGRGRALLQRGDEGGDEADCRLVQVVVPPACRPGDFFPHLDHRGNGIIYVAPTAECPGGHYASSRSEAEWEVKSGTRSDERNDSCPVGPVPEGGATTMTIELWRRRPRLGEVAKRDARAAEATEWDGAVAAACDADDDGRAAIDDDDDDERLQTWLDGFDDDGAEAVFEPGADGHNLLHHAAQKGAARCMCVLLRAQADPLQRDAGGLTALWSAVRHAQPACVHALLEAMPDADGTALRNTAGVSALELAVGDGKADDFGAELLSRLCALAGQGGGGGDGGVGATAIGGGVVTTTLVRSERPQRLAKAAEDAEAEARAARPDGKLMAKDKAQGFTKIKLLLNAVKREATFMQLQREFAAGYTAFAVDEEVKQTQRQACEAALVAKVARLGSGAATVWEELDLLVAGTGQGGTAGADWKQIVGSALLVLEVSGGAQALDLVLVADANGKPACTGSLSGTFAVLATKAGGALLEKVARSMSFEAAQGQRGLTKPFKAGTSEAKHRLGHVQTFLCTLQELGVTSFAALGLDVLDPRNLTEERLADTLDTMNELMRAVHAAAAAGGAGLTALLARVRAAIACESTPTLAGGTSRLQLQPLPAPIEEASASVSGDQSGATPPPRHGKKRARDGDDEASDGSDTDVGETDGGTGAGSSGGGGAGGAPGATAAAASEPEPLAPTTRKTTKKRSAAAQGGGGRGAKEARTGAAATPAPAASDEQPGGAEAVGGGGDALAVQRAALERALAASPPDEAAARKVIEALTAAHPRVTKEQLKDAGILPLLGRTSKVSPALRDCVSKLHKAL